MYPITYEAEFNPAPNRWTTFFRPLLAIPWIVVGLFWGLLFAFTHVFAWIAVTILGRYPQWLYDFNSGVVRYLVRTGAWFYLQTDEWPPFGLKDDPDYPIRVGIAPAPASQSRPKAFFRLILVLPIAIVVSYGSRVVLGGLVVIAWLTIVFRGYLPEGVNAALTYVNSLDARVFGYAAILTDEYPPVGLERAGGSGAVATSAPPAPEAA
ncbi:MAG TPA: DUF4389 domain-containing protein [Solirubrobacterales bacterium]|nr:DUF4389 domain-containing protein [Solirubrobacterales bacterium]